MSIKGARLMIGGTMFSLVSESGTLSPQDAADQINKQAGRALVEAVSDGIRVLDKDVAHKDVRFIPAPPKPTRPGRVVHQELRGRRAPKGWVKEELTALRLTGMAKTKAERNKEKKRRSK